MVFSKFSLEEKIFVVQNYYKYGYNKVISDFYKQFNKTIAKKALYKLIKKFETTGSVANISKSVDQF